MGVAGLTLPGLFSLRANASTGTPTARSCIVIYTWGGMSHYESFDPKPDAPVDLRGEFKPIPTATPGIHFCEHLPHLSKHSDKLAIVRSVHHKHGGHQQGMYISLTGRDPEGGIAAGKRTNFPSLPAMISRFHHPLAGTPGAIRLPYLMYDNGKLMAGQDGGWLGPDFDPVLMRTPSGKPYAGVTRYGDRELELKLNTDKARLSERRTLLEQLDDSLGAERGQVTEYDRLDHFRQMAADMLLGSPVRDAYDLEKEDPRVREMYGDHICGQPCCSRGGWWRPACRWCKRCVRPATSPAAAATTGTRTGTTFRR